MLTNHLLRQRAADKASQVKQKETFVCEECNVHFTRRSSLNRHFKHAHTGGGQAIFCGICDKTFPDVESVTTHRQQEHTERSDFQQITSAHRKSCELFRLTFPDEIVLVSECLIYSNMKIKQLLQRQLGEKKFMKSAITLTLRFAKPDYQPQHGNNSIGFESTEVITMNLRSRMHTFMIHSNIAANMMEMYEEITNICDDFVSNGSGWILSDCVAISVEIYQCMPLQGSCEQHDVYSKGRKIIIKNNTDDDEMNGDRCFFRAIASHFLPDQSIIELENWLKANVNENIATPVRVSSISKFEETNKHLDFAVNVVFKDETDLVFPVHASKNISAKHIINLMLFFTTSPLVPEESVLHYARIKNISNLIASRTKDSSNSHHTRNGYLCFNCFCRFARKEALQSHIGWCHKESGQRIVLPQPGSTMEYEKAHKEFKLGYVFFFDFETIQKAPAQRCSCPIDKLSKCKHKSTVLAEHEAFAFSLVMIDRESEVIEDISYVGEDAMKEFLNTLTQLITKYTKKLTATRPIDMSPEEESQFNSAYACHICKEALRNDRVRDHDHITGQYVGAAHNICNLHRQECKKIVGFAHNFSGYDSHLIMKALGDTAHEMRLTAIPLNTEKFKMLKLNNCVLMDSMSFLNGSLDKLVNTLKVSNHSFPIIKQWIPIKEERELILRKGVYPYEFVTDMDKIDNCHELPPRESFFSRLSGQSPSEEDYAHAQNVWTTFGCKSMRDYTELYVKADTYQLAEAMIQLRDSLMSEFQIDLCHYMSLPMMAKDIMLKTTNVKMELMSDIDMIQFVRSSIRGGLSFVNNRHFHVEEEKEKRDENVSLVYVDANNLYGAAMRFPLPVNDFKWMDSDEIESFSASKISKEDERGFIIEVDLEYPDKLHETHSSFPLAAHQMEITNEHLSPYAHDLLISLKKKKKYSAKKLTSTFLPRKNYVCHALNLQYYLEQGMKLVKIHRGISFRQEAFLKPYIDMCTKKRAAAMTKAESDLYKFLSNSLYGKVTYH